MNTTSFAFDGSDSTMPYFQVAQDDDCQSCQALTEELLQERVLTAELTDALEAEVERTFHSFVIALLAFLVGILATALYLKGDR